MGLGSTPSGMLFQEPKVDLDKIYNRFTKSKKEITIQDLQKEIRDTKFEMRNLNQELTILRVDYGLINLRVKNLEFTSHLEGDEETPSLNPSNDEIDETVNPTAEIEYVCMCVCVYVKISFRETYHLPFSN